MSKSHEESVQLKGFRSLSPSNEVYGSGPKQEQQSNGYVNNGFTHDTQARGDAARVDVRVVPNEETANISFDVASSSLTELECSGLVAVGGAHKALVVEVDCGQRPDKPASESSASSSSFEPFQVVWRDLTYEIEPNTLVQSVKSTARGLRNFISRSSKGNNINPDNNFEPFTIGPKASLSDPRVAFPNPKRRAIFENLNGYIKSGEITAILGPSGAGKTSLLNAICGFDTQNYKGSLQLLGGRHRKRMKLSIIPQKDYLIENLSVHENLRYSSRILNVDKNFDHERNIRRVVKVLNLMNCFKTECKNLSGGEYKRVSIAQELLRQPDILVLDEPTSGLDSLNCKRLIKTLRDLVEASNDGTIAPMAIVMTIHQPDIEIFSMFDHIYCLAQGRRVIYDNHPRNTIDILQKQGRLEVAKSELINPANLLIEVASGVEGSEETLNRLAAYQQQQFEQYFRATMNESKFCSDETLLKVSSNISISEQKGQLYRDKRLDSRHKQKGLFWYHTGLLTRRAFLGTIRDPMVTIIALAFYIVAPLVMWTVYSPQIGKVDSCPLIARNISMLKLADESTETIFRNLQEELVVSYEGTTMFFVTSYAFSMCTMAIAALAFPLNMHILLKELRNGWYSMPTFVLAKTISSFPFEVIYPSASIMLIYYLIGMPSSWMQWRMWSIVVVIALLSLISTTQGLVFGALFMDDTQAAIFLALSSTLPQVVLSGYPARVVQMPRILQHLSWTSVYRYSSDAIAIIRYGYGLCTCEPETEAFLRATKPQIEDIPDQMKPMIDFYYSNIRSSSPPETDIETFADAENSTDLVSYGSDFNPVPGISYELLADSDLERRVIDQINSNELDIFKRIAQVVSKSLSYGRDHSDCKHLRSELLAGAGVTEDDWLPFLILCMIGLFFVWKIVLYIVVLLKVKSRI